jgi:hypothetical protein
MALIISLSGPLRVIERSEATEDEREILFRVSSAFFEIIDLLKDGNFFSHTYEIFFENFEDEIKNRDRLEFVTSMSSPTKLHYYITQEGLIRVCLPKDFDEKYKKDKYIQVLKVFYIGIMCANLLKMPKKTLIISSLEQYDKNSIVAIKCLHELIDSLILNGLINLANEDINKFVSNILKIETQKL